MNCAYSRREIRLETLKIIGSRGFGHVGGSMSMADTLR